MPKFPARPPRIKLTMYVMLIIGIIYLLGGIVYSAITKNWSTGLLFSAPGMFVILLFFIFKGKNNFASVGAIKRAANPLHGGFIYANGKWREASPKVDSFIHQLPDHLRKIIKDKNKY